MWWKQDEKCVYPFMAALEMIHTYSLVHDDLPAAWITMITEASLKTHKNMVKISGYLQEMVF